MTFKTVAAGIAEAIADAVRESGKDKHVQEALAVAGADPAFTRPKAFTEMIRKDDARLGELVRRFPLED